MNSGASTPGSGSPEEENLRQFLREAFGGALPEEALEGMDLSQLAQQANLPQDPAQLRAAAMQMQHLFSRSGDGPVNWKLAQDVARQTAVSSTAVPGLPEPSGTSGDPGPTDAQVKALREAEGVARLWLDPVLSIDLPATELGVYSRGTWLARTLPRWQSIVEPVAQYMAGAIGEAIAAQMQSAPMPIPGDPAAMMERVGGTMFGVQFGYAIGALAREVCGTTDLSLPLGREGEAAVVALNIDDLVREHSLDPAAARIFLVTRELAHIALFAAHPWLRRALFSAIDDYARGITLDLDALDEMVRDLDLSDPSAMQAKRPEELFVFTRRAAQDRALEELATTLALIESWVDHVTAQALEGKLPQIEALREVVRRRRATGSPAEQMLAQTVGIELRPRRVREALAWWESVLATEGMQGRDAVWEHPDLLPGSDVLSGTPQAPRDQVSPSPDATSITDGGGTARASADAPGSLADVEFPADFDAELERLLAGENAESAPVEDEQGGLRERDASDARGSEGPNDPDDAQGPNDPDAPEDPDESDESGSGPTPAA